MPTKDLPHFQCCSKVGNCRRGMEEVRCLQVVEVLLETKPEMGVEVRKWRRLCPLTRKLRSLLDVTHC
jgi:hypothetical protein